jgi:pilus assembly protein CpaE
MSVHSLARDKSGERAKAAPDSAGARATSAAAPAARSVGAHRVAIHVFYDSEDVHAVSGSALADRRLAGAAGALYPGGLPAAVAAYQSRPTPSIVVVETKALGAPLFEDLGKLAEVCDPSTRVLMVGRVNDIGLYQDLISRGVSDYIVAPLEATRLIEAIARLYETPSAAAVGRGIAVVGARGGAGASTVAHNLAYVLGQTTHASTVLADFDLAFGTAGLNFNHDPLHGVAAALAQPDRLDSLLLERMMVRCSDYLSLFAAPATLDDDYDIPADAYDEVIRRLKSSAPFVVLDLPNEWSQWMRRTLLAADEVVVVAGPDLASLRNAKNLIELLKAGRPNDGPPILILNQVGLPQRPEIPVKIFAETVGLPPAMVLPFETKLFETASLKGKIVAEISPTSKFAKDMEQLAGLVSGREPVAAQKGKPKFPLPGLFKKK